MADIVQFVPKINRSSQANLDEFIRLCRHDLIVFGADLNWDDDYWEPAGISFANLDQTASRFNPKHAMKSPFKDFAKAYLRYQQGFQPTKVKCEMYALKCLERALEESGTGCEIHRVDLSHFDRAALLARTHFSAGVAYQAGRELAELATFISDKQLVNRRFDWKNPNQRPIDTVRTGKKAREEREKKLPSDEALQELASIFAGNPSEARDIFTTSTVLMLLCTPSRSTEIIALPHDCEIWETKRDGKKAYGWRFLPGKGAPPMIKWVPDTMAELAQEAIGRIRRMTDEARRLAKWLEANPDKFYRHNTCPDVDEDAPLSASQAALALGLSVERLAQTRQFLSRRYGLSGGDGETTLSMLNDWVHSRLPKGFPWFDEERKIRYSEALFCMRARELRTDTPASPIELWKPTVNVLNNDLGSRMTSVDYISPSIFDRYIPEAKRPSPLKVTTHQFRHLLNTMAQRGGMTQHEIARWSGRADTKQNRVYDHMTEFELVDLLRQHDPGLSLDRPLTEIAEQLAKHIPMTRQEFNTLVHPTAHITEFGFCIHNFVMAPCQRYRDCLNCSEQVCIKGDKRISGLRLHYQQVKALLESAEKAIAEGLAGADRWYEIQSLTEKRLAALLTILEDPTIEDGAVIRLSNEHEFSPWRRALEVKKQLQSGNQPLLPVLN